MIDSIKALLLGIIQGLTEFLPISSSGHLVLSKYFLKFGQTADISFEIFLHLGSLLAVVIFFRKDIFELIKSIIYIRNPDFKDERKICLWLIVATFFTGVLGLLFKDVFETLFSTPIFAAIMISITGLIVFYSDMIKSKKLSINDLTFKKSAFIGIGQALAITPGISRSGSTIAASLLTGLSRKNAATFSFLLSIPAILGANISEIKTFLLLDIEQLEMYLLGFVAAFISGYLVIGWLMKLIIKAKLHYFSYYCWFISFVCVTLLLLGL
ncbi:MAG: undecaprenyl-diphosphate phosphatase [Candidatus Cloacimonetes bacterium]|nr:undecaprenyl-diphosphate phosphatase [Candidatus Cloacimonadota bacterium]